MSCCIRSPHSVANTTFGVPKNELEKNKWEEALGMKLKKSHRVCASHFNECDITSCWNSGLNNYSVSRNSKGTENIKNNVKQICKYTYLFIPVKRMNVCQNKTFTGIL